MREEIANDDYEKLHWMKVFRARGHKPVTWESGNIDVFAFAEGEFHNGPACANCGWGECWHCDPAGNHIPLCTGNHTS